jgi:cytochrome c peroxidase
MLHHAERSRAPEAAELLGPPLDLRGRFHGRRMRRRAPRLEGRELRARPLERILTPRELSPRRSRPLGHRRSVGRAAPRRYADPVYGKLAGLLALVSACTPPPSALPDVGPEDALDAGCDEAPGILSGAREVRAGGLLPDLAFSTPEGEVRLSSFHAPCAGGVLVIRSLAAWSGPSRWHAAHTATLRDLPRVELLDLLTDDEDALPADLASLRAFAARYDEAPAALAIDPEDTFGPLAFGGIRLPLVLVVDARDLRVVRVLFAPHAGEIEHAARAALAAIDGAPPPPPPELTRFDGRFTRDGWDLVQDMAWRPPPADPSNRVADDPAAAALGGALFGDPSLSPAGVSCARCHAPERAFTDGLPVARGLAEGARNTPTLLGAAHARWPFWDGRADSLWAQALGPLENPDEMDSSRLFVAHRIAAAYATRYEAVFGPLPALADAGRFPAAGRPGEPAYDALSELDRAAVDAVFANVGKAIAAFERTLRPPETAFDRYLAGDLEALTATERDGLSHFIESACVQCHFGPTLGNDAFFAIAMPGHGPPPSEDRGRFAALAALQESRFRRTGPFSDDPAASDPLAGWDALPPSTLGAFRTPPLRALATTAPYGHAGTFGTLREVVVHYATIRVTGTSDPRVVGVLDPHVPAFDAVEAHIGPLTALLERL